MVNPPGLDPLIMQLYIMTLSGQVQEPIFISCPDSIPKTVTIHQKIIIIDAGLNHIVLCPLILVILGDIVLQTSYNGTPP